LRHAGYAMTYLENVIREFRKSKKLADDAVRQITEEDLFAVIGPESNSIAIIMKHLAGNMLSRWADFLASDGEKPNRNRDSEFVIADRDKSHLLEFWESGWQCLFDALAPLTADDLDKTVFIRSEPNSVMQAINRQLTHYAYHVGQLVLLARYFAGEKWKTLSIPKGKSEEFNQTLRRKQK
jgi:hypothetical protein